MKAIIFDEPGGLEKLKYVEDFPTPEPKAGEVLLKVKASSLNHLDIWIRNGIAAYGTTFPHISGCDISGVIEKTAGGASHWKKGDEVLIYPGITCGICEACESGRENLCKGYTIIGAGTNGGFAEYCLVPAKNLFRKPKNLSFEEAAAFPLVTLTSWHMLKTRANLKKGQSVLVLGASSGIGTAAVQIAKAEGAFVIATAGSADKLERVKKLGADELIDHNKEDILERVKKITGGRGVDVVYEHIGPTTWDKSIKSLVKGGTLVTCGATTGPTVQTDLRYVYSRELSILGSLMGTRKELEALLPLIESGKIKTPIDSTFPLKEVAVAEKKLESRDFFGKIVVRV
ncbi:MAG: zinc-binding dehydrogenase [Deltaproteobacteria bacterium]|nr:zinc-binding dehydrogenase [Deltaproteobacteria bacterium]